MAHEAAALMNDNSRLYTSTSNPARIQGLTTNLKALKPAEGPFHRCFRSGFTLLAFSKLDWRKLGPLVLKAFWTCVNDHLHSIPKRGIEEACASVMRLPSIPRSWRRPEDPIIHTST